MLKKIFLYPALLAFTLGVIAQTCLTSEAAVRKERIMVVIPEIHLGRPKVPDPAGETEIVRKLIEEGYKLVDQEQVKKIRYNDIFDKAWKGDDTGALKMARKFNAEILIVGEAFSEFAPGNPGSGYERDAGREFDILPGPGGGQSVADRYRSNCGHLWRSWFRGGHQ